MANDAAGRRNLEGNKKDLRVRNEYRNATNAILVWFLSYLRVRVVFWTWSERVKNVSDNVIYFIIERSKERLANVNKITWQEYYIWTSQKCYFCNIIETLL